MTVIFAGGGTGGHLFPGLAVARLLRANKPEIGILFVGTPRGMEKKILKDEFDFIAIDAVGMAGGGPWRKVAGLYPLGKSIFQARGIVNRVKPRLVFGLGGYSAGPVGIAARLGGIPLVLHEQNMIPGMTNKLLARWARKIYVSFPGSADFFPSEKTEIVGNPIRPELLAASPGQRNGRFSILVLGGSQGSRFINQTVVRALELMPDSRNALSIVHQTGETNFEETERDYQRLGMKAAVKPFIEDMGTVYANADLIIARAGATTIAEITALKKTAIFIPYPFAAHNHQEKNARFVESEGACKVLLEAETTPELLAATVRDIIDHPEELALMRKRSASLGAIDAAERIYASMQEYLHDLR